MRQIWIPHTGPPTVLTLREAPDPIPRNGEVRIRVAASGVNFDDIRGRLGLLPNRPPLPYVPGFEVAGTVDAIGQGVKTVQEGDPVFALVPYGGYADVVCVPKHLAFKRLDWMSATDGAALPFNYLTAFAAMMVMGSLRQGNRVLIHAAAGGVGLAAIDIGRILEADMFGTASSEKHAFIRERGLQHPIDYHHVDYEKAIREQLRGGGLDLILEPLGGRHWRKNYRLLNPTGRLIHYGSSSLVRKNARTWLTIPRLLRDLPRYTPLTLIADNKGVNGFDLTRLWQESDLLRRWMARLIHWYDEARFRPHVDRTFPLSEAAAAHRYLQERKNIGKVLLVTDA